MNMTRFQLIESIRLGVDVLKAHRLRSGLVILGVAVAIATLMGMVATLSGLSAKIQKDITGGEAVVIQVSKFDFVGGDPGSQRDRKNLTSEDARALERLPYVKGVSIGYQQGRPLRHGNQKARLISVIGSTVHYTAINHLAVNRGRFFTAYETEHRRSVAVLGERPATELFPGEDPIGKYIRIADQEYQVVGVFGPNESIFARLFGSLAQNFVVVPYTAYERDFMFRRESMFLQVLVDSKAHLDAVKEAARSVLRIRRKVMPGMPDDFALNTAEAALQLVQKLTGPIGLGLVVMSSIGLMVGGIGVMVIMLVSVTERTREIGIRKALGATRREIVWQFLAEASFLTCIGGIIGVIGGLTLAFVITRLGNFPFSLPFFWVALSVVISVSIGLIFGLYPANRAARLDPIEALRQEV